MIEPFKMQAYVNVEVGIDKGGPFYIMVKDYDDAELILQISTGDDDSSQHDYDLVFFPLEAEALRLRSALRKASKQLAKWLREHKKHGGDDGRPG